MAYNAIVPPTPTVNLYLMPEQWFSNNHAWGNAGPLTITDYYATSPAGDATASRVQASGAGNRYMTQQPTVAAGTYTFSFYVASNTGLAQSVRTYDPKNGFSSNVSIPATGWVRVVWTAVGYGGGALQSGIANDAAADAMDVLVWGAQLESGSSATPYARPAGHFYLVGSPTWTPRGLSFSGAQYGLATLAQSQSLSQTTVYAAFRRVGTPFDGTAGNAPILADPYGTGHLQFSAQGGIGATQINPMFRLNTSFASVPASSGGGAVFSVSNTLTDGDWHILTGVSDGTTVSVYLDGFLLNSLTASPSTTVQQLFLSNYNFAAYFPGEIGAVALYSTAHSAAQIRQTIAALQSLMASRGVIAAPRINKFLVWEGDSITAYGGNGVAGTSQYPYRVASVLPTPAISFDYAVSGSQISDMNTRRKGICALLDTTRPINVLVVFIGHNDFIGGALTVAQFVERLRCYCQSMRSAGWKVVLCTLLPSTSAGFNALRNSANTLIYGDSSFYDALCDFGAEATMGPDAAASNATYYSDGTHPTVAGHALLAPLAQAAVQKLL